VHAHVDHHHAIHQAAAPPPAEVHRPVKD
jgi:hypothetical protein